MGFSSIWHWIIVLLIVLLLFGAGKLPKVMGDLAKGIKNFKAGLKDEDEASSADGKALSGHPATPAPATPAPAASAPAATVEHAVKKDEAARS